MSTAETPKCNWPIPVYLIAMIPGAADTDDFHTEARWILAQCYSQCNALSLLVFLGRLFLALHRKEQSRSWIPYVILMLLAAPFWLFLEPLFFNLFYSGRHAILVE